MIGKHCGQDTFPVPIKSTTKFARKCPVCRKVFIQGKRQPKSRPWER